MPRKAKISWGKHAKKVHYYTYAKRPGGKLRYAGKAKSPYRRKR